MNKYTYKPPCSRDQLVEMYHGAGMTYVEIAERLGCTAKRIYTAMRKLNIQPRPSGVIRDQKGSKNAMWKGAEASYKAKHLRLVAARGRPKRCEHCETTDPRKAYEWASLTKKYDDPMDYVRLCKSCHRKMDNSVKNLVN